MAIDDTGAPEPGEHGFDDSDNATPVPLDEETWLRLTGGEADARRRVDPVTPKDPGIIDPVLDRPVKKPTTLDLEMDPLLRLEEHHSSIKGAIIFALCIPAVTILTGLVIAVISRAHGGPLCDGGYATWICTRTFEIIFPVVPGLVSFTGLIGAALICYSKARRDLYWQPWLGIIWILMPFTILWATGVGTMAVVGHHH